MLTLKSIELQSANNLSQLSTNNFIKIGKTGQDVLAIQRALFLLGYDMSHSETSNDTYDGIYGQKTFATVDEFQSHQLIENDGLVGPDTIGRIDADLHVLAPLPDSAIKRKFNIYGTPIPKNMPKNIIWRPARYVRLMDSLFRQLFSKGTVPRAICDHLAKRINVRPEPDIKGRHAHHDHGLLEITPGKYDPANIFYDKSLGVDFELQYTILHELFHAMRYSNKKSLSDNFTDGLNGITYPPGATAKPGKIIHPIYKMFFKDRGEFLAIMVVNIFRSEMNPAPLDNKIHRQGVILRKDHGSHQSRQVLLRPDLFHKFPRFQRHIRAIIGEQPDFCRRLATSSAPFNPIRDYLLLPKITPIPGAE